MVSAGVTGDPLLQTHAHTPLPYRGDTLMSSYIYYFLNQMTIYETCETAWSYCSHCIKTEVLQPKVQATLLESLNKWHIIPCMKFVIILSNCFENVCMPEPCLWGFNGTGKLFGTWGTRPMWRSPPKQVLNLEADAPKPASAGLLLEVPCAFGLLMGADQNSSVLLFPTPLTLFLSPPELSWHCAFRSRKPFSSTNLPLELYHVLGAPWARLLREPSTQCV